MADYGCFFLRIMADYGDCGIRRKQRTYITAGFGFGFGFGLGLALVLRLGLRLGLGLGLGLPDAHTDFVQLLPWEAILF